MPASSSLNKPSSRLFLLGIVSAILYGLVTAFSYQFNLDNPPADRPLLTVLLLFGAAFLAYLLACCEIWPTAEPSPPRKQDEIQKQSVRGSLKLIVGFGILFRVIMLFSVPIQEIDLYRYIVDGAVGNTGSSPYEFAPAEIARAVDTLKDPNSKRAAPDVVFARSSDEQQELTRVAELFVARPGLDQCLHRVHYGNYTSPYPPVSQAVFRIATGWVPDQASERVWLLAMKSTLILFDILTGLLLIGLMRHCQLPQCVSLLYWWCPLVMKEIANSGHLDSIAICLSVGFAWLSVAAFWSLNSTSSDRANLYPLLFSIGAAVMLGLAVGSKIYPIVLAPVWAICLLRQRGIAGLVPVLVFSFVAAACLWPILQSTSAARDLKLVTNEQVADETLILERQQKEQGSNARVLRRPQAGIGMFSKYWEMNDLIFMFIVENVRPNQPTNGSAPWFLITSEKWRSDFSESISDKIGISRKEFAFSFTRILTLLAYTTLTLGFCVFAWRAKSSRDLLRLYFLSVAWFWLLSPTQNPWYWLWALPFLPFVKRPIPWLLLSGTLFLYYLRFYFQNHFAGSTVWPTQYKGQLFFDFVIPWIEFSPIYLILLWQGIANRKNWLSSS